MRAPHRGAMWPFSSGLADDHPAGEIDGSVLSVYWVNNCQRGSVGNFDHYVFGQLWSLCLWEQGAGSWRGLQEAGDRKVMNTHHSPLDNPESTWFNHPKLYSHPRTLWKIWIICVKSGQVVATQLGPCRPKNTCLGQTSALTTSA